MKHSDTHNTTISSLGDSTVATILWVWTLLLSIIPSIGLTFTDTLLPGGPWQPVIMGTLILLPLGCWLIVMSLPRRIGITFWVMFPVIFLSAFQMVLLDLFGSQPIAVDMWLNLVTTNPTEAGELMGSLFLSLMFLTVGYIPAIILAVVATIRRWNTPSAIGVSARRSGVFVAAMGLVLLIAAKAMGPGLSVRKSMFPVNVVYNAWLAVDRTTKIANYNETCAGFTYRATSLHPDSLAEVYAIVVGETARADHFSLCGYDRPTNPRLSALSDRLVACNALSESNTTHKSVPMLLSYLDARNFEDSIYTSKGLLTALREAGFSTAFISNQGRNGSFIDFFGEEADTTVFLRDTWHDPSASVPHDLDLLPHLAGQLHSHPDRRLAIVLHSYGSHFKYDDRYPADFDAPFPVNGFLKASPDNRDNLVNAYDNTIAYTDTFLASIADTLCATGRPAAMVYVSDHGEDIYDDRLNRFLHASPLPTYHQLHVPLIVWCSEAYDAVNPGALDRARANSSKPVSSTRSFFHTILDIAGIATPYFRPDMSLINDAYAAPDVSLYLNDHNEAVPLADIVMTP